MYGHAGMTTGRRRGRPVAPYRTYKAILSKAWNDYFNSEADRGHDCDQMEERAFKDGFNCCYKHYEELLGVKPKVGFYDKKRFKDKIAFTDEEMERIK